MGRHTPLSLSVRTNRARSDGGRFLVLSHTIWLVIDQDRPVAGSNSTANHKVSRGDSRFPFRERLDELCKTRHSKTVFSLRFHHIFTALSFSSLDSLTKVHYVYKLRVAWQQRVS